MKFLLESAKAILFVEFCSKSLGAPSPNLGLNNQPSSEAYLRPWKTYMMEFFVKMVKG